MRGEADGRADLEVPKDGDASLRVDDGGVRGERGRRATAAHAEELDFRHDEAVAAAVFAHDAVEVREALQVEDLLWGRLAAHARVPLVVTLDETDDAAAAIAIDGLLVVGWVAGDELGLLSDACDGLDRAHHHVCASLGDLERGIDFGCVVVCADILEGWFVLGLEVLAWGFWEVVG